MRYTQIDEMAAEMQTGVLQNEHVQSHLKALPYAEGSPPWDLMAWHELPESLQGELQMLDQERPWGHPGIQDDEDAIDRLEAEADKAAAANRTQWFDDPMTGHVKSMIQQMHENAGSAASEASTPDAHAHITVWNTLRIVLEMFDSRHYQG